MTATRFTMDRLMHGVDYSGEECAGFVAQRKWNGVFAGWDGERLWTKPSPEFPHGNVIHAPDFFTEGLPDFPLCCELVAEKEGANFANGLLRGRANFSSPAGYKSWGDRWRNAKLHVFDAPEASGGLMDRVDVAATGIVDAPFTSVVNVSTILDRAELREFLGDALSWQWEGLMIQPPDHAYQAGRTRALLKVKRQSLHFLKGA